MSRGAHSNNQTQERTLRNRCNEILENIYRSELASDSDMRKEHREALKREYNQLSLALDGLYQAYPRDRLLSLPPELWTEIIWEVVNENGFNMTSTDALLILTLVNSRWRAEIMKHPRLWAHITIGRGEADAHAKLQAALHLSGKVPLQLTINIIPCQWADDLPILRPHIHRIEEIILWRSQRRNYDTDKSAIDFLKRLLCSLGRLPSLQIIQCRNHCPLPLDDIFKSAPNLTYLYGHTLSSVAMKAWIGTPFRGCDIDHRSSGAVLLHENAIHLQDLTWFLYRDANIRRYSSFHSLTALKRISAFGAANADLYVMLKRTSSLTTLDISICNGWKDLHPFFNLLEHLPQLFTLRLTLSMVSGKIAFSSLRLVKTHVQELYVSIYTEGDESEEKERERFENGEAVFSVFPALFSDVKRFSLKSFVLGPRVAAYIASIPRLWSLDLGYVFPGMGDVSIISSSLETLYLDVEAYVLQWLVPTIDCPSLSRLEWIQDCYGFPDMFYCWIHDGIRDSVEFLRVKTSNYQWMVSWFHALRRLQVGGRYYDDNSQSDFLTSFILEPDICPALQELEINFVPEWDLLFLMLERRNYLPLSQGIARIKRLALPISIASALLIPLTDILNGHFAERPSSLELSFCGIMEAYFDPNV